MFYIIRKKSLVIFLLILMLLLFSSCNSNTADKKDEISNNADDSSLDLDKEDQGDKEDSGSVDDLGYDLAMFDSVKAVSAGSNYSFLLTEDYTLYSWGENDEYVLGRLGIDSPIPEIVMTDVLEMTTGYNHSGAIKSDHSLWLWGSNQYKQLGDFTGESSAQPIKVMEDVQSVVLGLDFSVVLKTDGTVWTFGRNQVGQLGLGTTADSAAPVKVLEDVIKVSAGQEFVLALKTDGTVWGWGVSDYGQLLGKSNGQVEKSSSTTLIQTSPVQLLENISDISCGASHGMALDDEGKLWTWGLNSSAQLGNGGNGTWVEVNYGGKELFSSEPNMIMSDVKLIEGGANNTAAIKEDNSLWVCGNNSSSQIGDGTSIVALTPVQVLEDVKSVSVGSNHIMAIKKDNSYWAWGSNSNNILGDGNPSLINEPIKIMDNVKMAAIYSDHSLAVTNNNELYTFGINSSGQLASGDFLNNSVPTLVMTEVEKVAAGTQHSICLKEDGSVWTWGSNILGQIGNGHDEEVYSVFDVWKGGHPVWADATGSEENTIKSIAYKPTKILDNAIDIFAKWHTSYAITSDKVLYGWGWNELYQLANDTRTSPSSPILMMEDVKMLAPSYALIKNDNSMWTWGYNATDPYNVLPVKALEQVQSIAVQDRSFLAVKADGTLWTWGGSISGKLINSSEYFETVDQPVQIGSNIAQVIADYQNIFVIDIDGVLWGLDTNEISTQALTSEDAEVFTYGKEYKIMENVKEVYLGLNSVLILKEDDSLWGFGSNANGQLGDGKRQFVPIQISSK